MTGIKNKSNEESVFLDTKNKSIEKGEEKV